MWLSVFKCSALSGKVGNCRVKMFIHSFIHSVYCADVTQWSTSILVPFFFLAIYSRAFKRPNQKLWTGSRETGPKHPEEPFCLTFIHSCSFSRVPPESIWQTLVKKKRLWGKKTTSRSWATHTPSAVVLSSFIIYRLCAPIWFLQLCGHCGCSCWFCLFVNHCDIRERGGGKSSPMCI